MKVKTDFVTNSSSTSYFTYENIDIDFDLVFNLVEQVNGKYKGIDITKIRQMRHVLKMSPKTTDGYCEIYEGNIYFDLDTCAALAALFSELGYYSNYREEEF